VTSPFLNAFKSLIDFRKLTKKNNSQLTNSGGEKE